MQKGVLIFAVYLRWAFSSHDHKMKFLFYLQLTEP